MAPDRPTQLIDRFDRRISYLRLSVTDRCDFRCQYCMAETMEFLPRSEVLTIEELLRTSRLITELGVRKIRVTGGEPLIRRGVYELFEGLGALAGLDSLALTTNGSQLADSGHALRDAGVNSINISLDSLQAERFKAITRIGDLNTVLRGIDRAVECGFDRIRLNAVILDGLNRDEVVPLTHYALERGIHIAFIEEMPLGQVNVGGKPLAYVSSDTLQEELAEHFTLVPMTASDTQCNRLRISAEGRLLMCLGNEESIDLRRLLRAGSTDEELKTTIIASLSIKPERHVFDQPEEPQIVRFMNATGG